MRCAFALVCVLLALVALCAAAGASPAAHYGRGSRPRTIRGFKNVALSTARGFGKRDGNGASQLEDALADRENALPDSFPVEWFAAEMQNNPELARMIVSKFVDGNQDGDLTAEELLRPTY